MPDASSGSTVLYSPDDGVGNATLAGSVGTITTTTVSSGPASSSPFVINLSWDASVASAPADFRSAVIAAAQYLESEFTDPVTINISVGYGEVDGVALASDSLGQSWTYLNSCSYSTLQSALAADANSSADSSFLASIPVSAPASGTFWTTSAQAKALGLAPATARGTDGFVGFSSSYPFSYNDSAGIPSGTYEFNGIALHELTEVMGRLMLGGGTIGSTIHSYDVLDLAHYSSAGVRTFSSSAPGYCSIDGGYTSLGQFNTAGGDGGDWASSVTNDALDAFSASGVVNAFSSSDLSEMDALGWSVAQAPTPAPNPSSPPTPTPSPTILTTPTAAPTSTPPSAPTPAPNPTSPLTPTSSPTTLTTPTAAPTSTPTFAPTPTPPDTVPINDATLRVQRFFDVHTGGHFYTESVAEAYSLTSSEDFKAEINGFGAVNPLAGDPSTEDLYRFFETATGGHFFTASASERDQALATRPDLKYEGITLQEHATQQAGDVPVYRFFDTNEGGHFFTADPTELATQSGNRTLLGEGVAFYAPRV